MSASKPLAKKTWLLSETLKYWEMYAMYKNIILSNERQKKMHVLGRKLAYSVSSGTSSPVRDREHDLEYLR